MQNTMHQRYKPLLGIRGSDGQIRQIALASQTDFKSLLAQERIEPILLQYAKSDSRTNQMSKYQTLLIKYLIIHT